MNLYDFNTIEQLASSIKTLIGVNFSVSTRLTSNNFFNAGTPSILTISSGAVTITQSNHILQSESGTADDLDTISGGKAGDIVIFEATNDREIYQRAISIRNHGITQLFK